MPRDPWASGPGEILRHGLDLFRRDSDTNRRLAMISIDNAVELMIKTYLGLPRRITGLSISRKEYADISESFPALLDALEKYAADKINGVDLGTIEWYHRLRNELYHQGNGLTVEKDKVQLYAELANLLFKNLFGVELVGKDAIGSSLSIDFIAAWTMLEEAVRQLVGRYSRGVSVMRPVSMIGGLRVLQENGHVTGREVQAIEALRPLRNGVVHGVKEMASTLDRGAVNTLLSLASKIEDQLRRDAGA